MAFSFVDVRGPIEQLPHKLSGCIRIAAEDLRSVEADPGYVIDMDTWHKQHGAGGDNRCYVCFAGAVMARELGAPPDETALPEDFGRHNRARLYALDNLRRGRVVGALRVMLYDYEEYGGYKGRDAEVDRLLTAAHEYEAAERKAREGLFWPSYGAGQDNAPFYAALERTAAFLASIGL